MNTTQEGRDMNQELTQLYEGMKTDCGSPERFAAIVTLTMKETGRTAQEIVAWIDGWILTSCSEDDYASSMQDRVDRMKWMGTPEEIASDIAYIWDIYAD